MLERGAKMSDKNEGTFDKIYAAFLRKHSWLNESRRKAIYSKVPEILKAKILIKIDFRKIQRNKMLENLKYVN